MKKKIQKPFDVEAAKNGAKVETRDGRSVRIICYDRKFSCPIIALILGDKDETCFPYNLDGSLGLYSRTVADSMDLVIIEEVECPKFNVGDWIFRDSPGASPLLIVAITSNCYMLQDLQGNKGEISQTTVDTFYRLWTIKDAKPGDVLVASDGSIFIFAGMIDSACKYYAALTVYNDVNINKEVEGGFWETSMAVYPASKRQRDLLFKKMEEEGYRWDDRTLTLWKKCN